MGDTFTGFSGGGVDFPDIPFLPNGAAATNYCAAVEHYFTKYADFIKDPALVIGQAALESAAQIAILAYQQDQYEEIADEQADLVTEALQEMCDELEACLENDAFECAYPDVPKAAEYVPVDTCEEYKAALECMIDTNHKGEAAALAVDKAELRSAIARVVLLDPKYTQKIKLHQCQVRDLLDGIIELDSVIEIVTDAAELGVSLGKIGCSRNLRRNALNRARLRTQAQGRQALKDLNDSMNRDVYPVAQQTSLLNLIQTPQQRISLALTQAQLVQQSLQNLYNQQSLKPPYKLAELQMKLQKIMATLAHRASKANLVNQYVPNYSGILQPQISTLSNFAVGAGFNIFGGNVNSNGSTVGIFDRGTQGFPTISGV